MKRGTHLRFGPNQHHFVKANTPLPNGHVTMVFAPDIKVMFLDLMFLRA